MSNDTAYLTVPKWTLPLLQEEAPATTFVYLRLLSYMYNRDPYVRVKISRLSADLGYARETVSRQLKRLQTIGLILIRRGAAGAPNEYIVLLSPPPACDHGDHDHVTSSGHMGSDRDGHGVVTADVTHKKKFYEEDREKKSLKTTALAGREEDDVSDDWFGTPLGYDESEREIPTPRTRRDTPTGLVDYFRDRVVGPNMTMVLGTHVNRPALMKAFKDAMAKDTTPDELRRMIDLFAEQISAKPLPSNVTAWKGFLARRDELRHTVRAVHGEQIDWDAVE